MLPAFNCDHLAEPMYDILSLPPLNQVVVSFKIVGLMRGEENVNGEHKYHYSHNRCRILWRTRLIPNGLCRPQKTEY